MNEDRAGARHAFVDRMGDLGASSGMPRMAARLIAYLLTVDEGHATAADLATALQASPAAISGAVRYLESLGLLRRTRERGSRRDLFVLEEEVWADYVARSLDVVALWGAVFAEGAQALPGGAAQDRLRGNAEFFAFLTAELRESVRRWHARGGPGTPERPTDSGPGETSVEWS